MNSKIGIGVMVDSVSEHPYILSDGMHTPYVSDNILVEQLQFYAFKRVLNNELIDENAKGVSKDILDYWSFYGMLSGERSIIESAIQKGFRLNYDALYEDIEKFQSEDGYIIDDDFINKFEGLRQLCEIKVIESRLLAMFDKEIQHEGEKGEVTLLQGIVGATDFIYSLYPSGFPLHTDLMRDMDSSTFFKVSYKGVVQDKELEREDALMKYLDLPVQLLDDIFIVSAEIDVSEEFMQKFVENLADFVDKLESMNMQHASAYKEPVSNVYNENQTYEPNSTKKEDDYSIQ